MGMKNRGERTKRREGREKDAKSRQADQLHQSEDCAPLSHS